MGKPLLSLLVCLCVFVCILWFLSAQIELHNLISTMVLLVPKWHNFFTGFEDRYNAKSEPHTERFGLIIIKPISAKNPNQRAQWSVKLKTYHNRRKSLIKRQVWILWLRVNLKVWNNKRVVANLEWQNVQHDTIHGTIDARRAARCVATSMQIWPQRKQVFGAAFADVDFAFL